MKELGVEIFLGFHAPCATEIRENWFGKGEKGGIDLCGRQSVSSWIVH